MAIDSTVGMAPGCGARRAARALLLLACCAAPTRADLWVREKLTGPDGKALGERTFTYAPGRVRHDQGGNGYLLDAKRGKGWRWMDGGGCVALGVPAAEAGGGDASGPNAGRSAAVLPERGGRAVTLYARPADTRTIAGVEATRVDVTLAGEPIEERWYAADVENKDFDELLLAWYSSSALQALFTLDEGQIAFQSVGRGYPVRAKNLRTGLIAEAVEIRRGAQPAAAFTPPAGCPGS